MRVRCELRTSNRKLQRSNVKRLWPPAGGIFSILYTLDFSSPGLCCHARLFLSEEPRINYPIYPDSLLPIPCFRNAFVTHSWLVRGKSTERLQIMASYKLNLLIFVVSHMSSRWKMDNSFPKIQNRSTYVICSWLKKIKSEGPRVLKKST